MYKTMTRTTEFCTEYKIEQNSILFLDSNRKQWKNRKLLSYNI